MIVYGRNPVREAIRGPRAVQRVWATKNATREPWLRGAGARVSVAPAEEIEMRASSDDHQWHGTDQENGNQPEGTVEPDGRVTAGCSAQHHRGTSWTADR